MRPDRDRVRRATSCWADGSAVLVRGALAAGAVLLVGAGAFVVATVPPTAASFYPKCLSHQLLGIHCPGCGLTRAAHSLLNGRLAQAFAYEPACWCCCRRISLIALMRSTWFWLWGTEPRRSLFPARYVLAVPGRVHRRSGCCGTSRSTRSPCWRRTRSGSGGPHGGVHVPQRHAVLAGDPGAVLVLRRHHLEPVARQPRFAFTGPHGVSTVDRLAPQLVPRRPCGGGRRTSPSRGTGSLPAPATFAGSQITLSSTPGRFFFIWIGIANTSSAPAANSRSMQ